MENQIVSTSENIPVNTSSNVWFGLSVSIDALIYEYASRRYYFTLTGDADSTTDIEIPISSIQCNRRNGEPTFLSVVIPDFSKYSEIISRPNGDLVVEMSYWFNNQDNFRSEIARATLESVPSDEGGQNQSITLSGHKTETWIPKTITETGASTYRRISSQGKITHRIVEPDIFINPGDTITISGDTFIVGFITIIIGALVQTVEITEA